MKDDEILQEMMNSFSELRKPDVASSIFNGSDFDVDKLLEWLDKTSKRRRYQNDTRNRNILAFMTMSIIIVWMLILSFVIFGNHVWNLMSDVVLVALLGTTTATVLGLAAIVLRGYFNSSGKGAGGGKKQK